LQIRSIEEFIEKQAIEGPLRLRLVDPLKYSRWHPIDAVLNFVREEDVV
jgi:hypothetical protein